jgi:hypothetical protein
MLQDPAATQKAFKEYGASHNGPMASRSPSASFASYASFGGGCRIRCAQEFDHLYVAVAEILADRLADPEDTSFHMVLFPVSMSIERTSDQAGFFATPAEMIGKMGFMIGLSYL